MGSTASQGWPTCGFSIACGSWECSQVCVWGQGSDGACAGLGAILSSSSSDFSVFTAFFSPPYHCKDSISLSYHESWVCISSYGPPWFSPANGLICLFHTELHHQAPVPHKVHSGIEKWFWILNWESLY